MKNQYITKGINIPTIYLTLQAIIIICIFLFSPLQTFGIDVNAGEELFIQHCAGCHINGGNIIRRGQTLKMKALKKRGLDDPELIAKVAREGIGIMSGYEEVLPIGGDKVLANWIWNQAQNAWIQG